MDGLGGLNKTENGIVMGLLQLRKGDITTADDLHVAAERLASFVHEVKRGRPNVDLIVFPEYSLNGASKALNAELQCTLDGPHIGVLRDAPDDNNREDGVKRPKIVGNRNCFFGRDGRRRVHAREWQ